MEILRQIEGPNKPLGLGVMMNISIASMALQDWPEAERRRYLLRLWICPPNGPSMPPAFA